ncbi:hypothetical protein [Nonomuraea dietziae]|uniref:hypothetical protein n=1 Tax=Nonomuraea dietziae TaxID=65515 RepID=UPI0031E022CA
MRNNSRFAQVLSFDIDRVAAAAGSDPDVLRMENLDTDVPPPPAAVEATVQALTTGQGNSWLPFSGLPVLREAIAADLRLRTGLDFDPVRQIVVTRPAAPRRSCRCCSPPPSRASAWCSPTPRTPVSSSAYGWRARSRPSCPSGSATDCGGSTGTRC